MRVTGLAVMLIRLWCYNMFTFSIIYSMRTIVSKTFQSDSPFDFDFDYVIAKRVFCLRIYLQDP